MVGADAYSSAAWPEVPCQGSCTFHNATAVAGGKGHVRLERLLFSFAFPLQHEGVNIVRGPTRFRRVSLGGFDEEEDAVSRNGEEGLHGQSNRTAVRGVRLGVVHPNRRVDRRGEARKLTLAWNVLSVLIMIGAGAGWWYNGLAVAYEGYWMSTAFVLGSGGAILGVLPQAARPRLFSAASYILGGAALCLAVSRRVSGLEGDDCGSCTAGIGLFLVLPAFVTALWAVGFGGSPSRAHRGNNAPSPYPRSLVRLFPRWRDSYWIAKAGTLAVTLLVLIIALAGSASVFALVVLAWSALASAPCSSSERFAGRWMAKPRSG